MVLPSINLLGKKSVREFFKVDLQGLTNIITIALVTMLLIIIITTTLVTMLLIIIITALKIIITFIIIRTISDLLKIILKQIAGIINSILFVYLDHKHK
jgi:hypothetical protein